jgi:hypothetical protein
MKTYTPEFFVNEAIGLIQFFGGFVPEERDWRSQCIQYFTKNGISQEHWDTIYYEALNLEDNKDFCTKHSIFKSHGQCEKCSKEKIVL